MQTIMQKFLRWARHLWLDADDTRRLLTPEGLQRLMRQVEASEARHLGELRVCVEAGLPAISLWRRVTPLQRAIALFGGLRVWDTAQNNGVLIYLLLAERRIEILADRGLLEHTTHETWQAVTDRLAQSLHAGAFEAGLSQAIREVDGLLRQHYPLQARRPNPNELPDAVVLI
jgi:hypothetical protein